MLSQCAQTGSTLAKISTPSSGGKNKAHANQQQIIAASWKGPLPDPSSIAKFDAIVQGGAERIFKMAELEQQHRISSEQSVIAANIEAQKEEANAIKRGHYLGASVSAMSVIGCVISIYLGAHWSVSIALVGVPLMGAVKTLITRK